MQQLRLDEAIEQINDAVISRLVEATKKGNLLENVKSIVRGDRKKPAPLVPAIWVFSETATPEHPPTTLQEKWEMPIMLVSVVKSQDTEKGYKNATKYAALARSVVIKDRVLGIRDIVQDVRSGRFEASYGSDPKLSLYSAVAVVRIVFRVREFY